MSRTATYSRVSSGRQEQEETIKSQLAALHARLRQDGVTDWVDFTDENYARENLLRPDLDRLRTLVDEGDVDTVYVHHCDRLSVGWRLIFLWEELIGNGAQVIFLNGAIDGTSEGKMMLGMQGIFGEYEKTKIAERTRRGKRYWAEQGAIVGGHVPYGFRLLRRSEHQRASLIIDDNQSLILQRMFGMLVDDHMSLRAIATTLTREGVPTARGAAQWQPMVVGRILRNPASKGKLVNYKTRRVAAKVPRSANPYTQNHKTKSEPRPPEEWVTISVPAIVEVQTWDLAQRQLDANAADSPRNRKRDYLLAGLIQCPRCGGRYTGHARGETRYYRCGRTDPALSSTGHRCPPGSFSADQVEPLVWDAIAEALQQPDMLVAEYQRRVEATGASVDFDAERKVVVVGMKRINGQQDRLTDAYKNEVFDLAYYKAEMTKTQEQSAHLEEELTRIAQRERQADHSEQALEQLQRFCSTISSGLSSMTYGDRRELLKLVVERVIVDEGRVTIETIIPGGDDRDRTAGHLRNRHPERSEESPTRPSGATP